MKPTYELATHDPHTTCVRISVAAPPGTLLSSPEMQEAERLAAAHARALYAATVQRLGLYYAGAWPRISPQRIRACAVASFLVTLAHGGDAAAVESMRGAVAALRGDAP